MACQEGHLGAVRALLAVGADKEAKSNVGGRVGRMAGFDGVLEDVVAVTLCTGWLLDSLGMGQRGGTPWRGARPFGFRCRQGGQM